MTKHQSIQLARWWVAIADVQAGIDNEIVPVGIHLKVEDQVSPRRIQVAGSADRRLNG